MSKKDYEELKKLTQKITKIVKEDLKKGPLPYDMKVEFGKINGKLALIDEISSGRMRVYKGDTWLHTVELDKYFK